jgi:hypothetical protein
LAHIHAVSTDVSIEQANRPFDRGGPEVHVPLRRRQIRIRVPIFRSTGEASRTAG